MEILFSFSAAAEIPTTGGAEKYLKIV